jgi:mandelate racemase
MSFESLTLKSIRARPVVLKLNRPVVARIAAFAEWPLILIDLYTEEGVIGRSYLEPYIRRSMRYLIPMLHDLGEMLKGRRLAPIELYEAARKSLHFVGYEGMAMITVAGIDMAAWDALARAAGVPLCVLLGGSIGAVPAYNSNGLWLRFPEEVAGEALELREEGGFRGLKLRLGRERLADDLATIEAVREAVGSEMSLMVDFNQGRQLGEALERCHAIDDLGLSWIEERRPGSAKLTMPSVIIPETYQIDPPRRKGRVQP